MAADRLRDSLAELVDDDSALVSVRTEIRESWRRSVQAGLRPDQLDVPFAEPLDTDAPLVRAAFPVLGSLIEDLAGSIVSVILTDDNGQVIDRRVANRGLGAALDNLSLAPGFVYGERQIGTNAIGTALAQRTPSMVVGHEHFAEAFAVMACAAVPIADPATGRFTGVIDLTCRAGDASRLMLPLARRAAREIELRLVDDEGTADRLLLQHFLRLRRGVKGPLVFINKRRMLTNAAADHLLGSTDAGVLWDHATLALTTKSVDDTALTLSKGIVSVAKCEPIFDGAEYLGALLQLRSTRARPTESSSSLAPDRDWGGLTDTEHSVATLATHGLTNREIGEHLFMSRFTVDAHLRSIYRKLGVNSRVGLANTVKS
jgi:transcriptional regulator of acetoin/glycerol metabolism